MRAVLFATNCLSVFKLVKYSADPKPVRRADGRVPRHSDVMGCGPLRIERRTGSKEEDRDCWTRVFRRSAGWRRTALETPEARPARKWKVGLEDLVVGRLASLAAPWDIAELERRQGAVNGVCRLRLQVVQTFMVLRASGLVVEESK